MSLRPLPSFSTGELDPALQERTNLQKYNSGAKTIRNWVISPTGSPITRAGRKNFFKTRYDNKEVVLFYHRPKGFIFEFGDQYVRLYTADDRYLSAYSIDEGFLLGTLSTTYTEAQLQYIKFEAIYLGLYVFVPGVQTKFITIDIDAYPTPMVFSTTLFDLPAASSGVSVTQGGVPAGYSVDYLVTYMYNGEESLVTAQTTGYNLPIAAGQTNILDATLFTGSSVPAALTEMRVYRRPHLSGAYGYIGSSSYFTISGGNVHGNFTDIGSDADYTHGPPASVIVRSASRGGTTNSPALLLAPTGVIYQQRLLLSDYITREGIFASRPGYTNNFYRDFPLGSDSALQFKAGSSGQADILRMIDNDGLVVFTKQGPYVHTGALSPTNISLDKKGTWIIDEKVPPLSIPGGVLFVDASTKALRVLAFSTELAAYAGDQLSAFSRHLFVGRRVTSIGFQPGDVPVLWLSFNDGKMAMFNFEPSQQMRAWSRGDSEYIQLEQIAVSIYDYVASTLAVEQIETTDIDDVVFVLVEKDGARYVEKTVPRYVSVETKEADTEWYLNESMAYMDSISTTNNFLNDNVPSIFTIVPVVTNDWAGQLNITTGGTAVFDSIGVGAILRYFNPDDRSAIDMEVITIIDPTEAIVQPNTEFPFDKGASPNIYAPGNTVTGLDHLEGEYVSVIVDGAVVASPNNDVDNLPLIKVESGQISLPDGMLGAIIHVGRAITGDFETLDIDTVEQRPVLIESKTANKVYVKTYNTKGLYVGNRFPANNKIKGMQSLESLELDYENDSEDNPGQSASIIGNTTSQASTKRVEVTLPGDWSRQGRICIRQVDPIHAEILSIIPDVEDLRR